MAVDVGSKNRKKNNLNKLQMAQLQTEFYIGEGIQQDRIVDYRYNFIILWIACIICTYLSPSTFLKENLWNQACFHWSTSNLGKNIGHPTSNVSATVTVVTGEGCHAKESSRCVHPWWCQEELTIKILYVFKESIVVQLHVLHAPHLW